VQNLAFFVFSYFKDDRIQAVAYPTDSQILLRNVRSLIEPIRLGNNSRASSNPMPRLGFDLRRLLFRGSKLKRI
jgi:hypothetical protein